MAKKEYLYKGKKLDDLKNMEIKELSDILPSRIRRSLKRGFTEQEKILLKKIKNNEKNIETHCREMPILPEMVGKEIKIYNGKEFFSVMITEEMIGHVLGEFSLTRKTVSHSSPGIGATKSSSNLSVK